MFYKLDEHNLMEDDYSKKNLRADTVKRHPVPIYKLDDYKPY